MKVLYDHQLFSYQIFGGASKYFFELLKKLPRDMWDTTIKYSNNIYIKNNPFFHYQDIIPDRYFKGKSLLMDYLNRPYSLEKMRSGDYSVFHQTFYGDWCHKAIGNKKMVITLHDLNHYRLADLYKQNGIKVPEKIVNLQKQSIARADKIIAVSHNTKKDLIEYWNVNPEKIVVVHHGIDLETMHNLEEKRIVDAPYVLFVGERYQYKNFERFAQAFRLVAQNFPELKLACTGKKFTEEETTFLNKLGVMHKTLYFSADEHSMARLYRDAEIFVYPSLYEGFGMPILEAMRYDCPVVLSNSSSFPEVAGEAGVYFDPLQMEDMAEKMELLLTSKETRDHIIQLGKQQLSQFSWEKTAREHRIVYDSLS